MATVALPLARNVTAIPSVAIFSRLGAISPFKMSLNLHATTSELKQPSMASNALAKIDELSVVIRFGGEEGNYAESCRDKK